MRKYVVIAFMVLCMLSLAACGKKDTVPDEVEATFQATILEIRDNHYLVEPVEGSQELKSSDQITVPIKFLDSALEPEVGDIIEIRYNGLIAESYPAQINGVYGIKVIEEAETISFHDKTFYKADLSQETIEWLAWYNDLSEEEQMSISYVPTDLYGLCGYPTAEAIETDAEFMEFEEKYGISLTAENITPISATIKCSQSGGEATGELQTGSWYVVERWTQQDGWKEVETILDKQEVGWTAEAYMITEKSTSEWEINWEWLYGELSVGKYRIGKQIMDWRSPGDYDTKLYYAEFSIKDKK